MELLAGLAPLTAPSGDTRDRMRARILAGITEPPTEAPARRARPAPVARRAVDARSPPHKPAPNPRDQAPGRVAGSPSRPWPCWPWCSHWRA
ncbi:hypothetical protein [Alloactinosynnema sp. L-07]|nr:hypothetical protein [Alloactinosynnema sp. L-07]